MDDRVEATLDLTDCKSTWEMHQRMKVSLDFPEHYGCNWSAFWDSMRIDSSVEYVRVVGVGSVSESMKESVNTLCKMLQECKDNLNGYGMFFDYEIVD